MHSAAECSLVVKQMQIFVDLLKRKLHNASPVHCLCRGAILDAIICPGLSKGSAVIQIVKFTVIDPFLVTIPVEILLSHQRPKKRKKPVDLME